MTIIDELEQAQNEYREMLQKIDNVMEELGDIKLLATRDVLDKLNPQTNKPLYGNDTQREIALKESLRANSRYQELIQDLKNFKYKKMELEHKLVRLDYKVRLYEADARGGKA